MKKFVPMCVVIAEGVTGGGFPLRLLRHALLGCHGREREDGEGDGEGFLMEGGGGGS